LKDQEELKMRTVSRNLLIYSDLRATLLNSKGHIIFDLSFDQN